jgi:hypothetical protein
MFGDIKKEKTMQNFLMLPQHKPLADLLTAGQTPSGGGVFLVYGPTGFGKTYTLKQIKEIQEDQCQVVQLTHADTWNSNLLNRTVGTDSIVLLADDIDSLPTSHVKEWIEAVENGNTFLVISRKNYENYGRNVTYIDLSEGIPAATVTKTLAFAQPLPLWMQDAGQWPLALGLLQSTRTCVTESEALALMVWQKLVEKGGIKLATMLSLLALADRSAIIAMINDFKKLLNTDVDSESSPFWAVSMVEQVQQAFGMPKWNSEWGAYILPSGVQEVLCSYLMMYESELAYEAVKVIVRYE